MKATIWPATTQIKGGRKKRSPTGGFGSCCRRAGHVSVAAILHGSHHGEKPGFISDVKLSMPSGAAKASAVGGLRKVNDFSGLSLRPFEGKDGIWIVRIQPLHRHLTRSPVAKEVPVGRAVAWSDDGQNHRQDSNKPQQGNILFQLRHRNGIL